MLPAGSRVLHTNCRRCFFTLVYSSDAAMAALIRGVLFSELCRFTNQAGLLASMRADSPVQAAGGGGGEGVPCSRRRRGGGRGVGSMGRCAPYRHVNRLPGSTLLPRFRRLTLHSGYDGWNDSAPKYHPRGAELPPVPTGLRRGRHPAVKMRSCTHKRTTRGTWLSGAKRSQMWTMFSEIWGGNIKEVSVDMFQSTF